MRLSNLWFLPLLLSSCQGARQGPESIFEDYQPKFQASPPLKLDDGAYDRLTAAPRNHSIVVLLTALEARFGCQLCRDFQPEWDLLGRSWARGDRKGEQRVLFGTLDFNDGKGTFQKVGWRPLLSRRSKHLEDAYFDFIVDASNGSYCVALPTNARS